MTHAVLGLILYGVGVWAVLWIVAGLVTAAVVAGTRD